MNRRQAIKNTVLAMGYTISVPSVISIFNSCTSDTATEWKPQLFSSEQGKVLGELAETILPRTQTPGARDLKIDQFIDGLIKRVFSEEDQQFFLKGIDAFEKERKDKNGKGFVESSTEQRNQLLTKMEQESAKLSPTMWGFDMKNANSSSFYRRVKELTLLGYFTSQEVGKNILVYDPVPGAYAGDISLSEVGKISFE